MRQAIRCVLLAMFFGVDEFECERDRDAALSRAAAAEREASIVGGLLGHLRDQVANLRSEREHLRNSLALAENNLAELQARHAAIEQRLRSVEAATTRLRAVSAEPGPIKRRLIQAGRVTHPEARAA